MNRFKKKLLGFTLIEMLIVMTIFIILFGITISAFSGLRNTILMNETIESIKRNFRWTQRSALLLKRNQDEGWIYGIGIDLSEYYTDTLPADELRSYKIFKWCAPCAEYNGCIGATAEIPGDVSPIEVNDTRLPLPAVTDSQDCRDIVYPPDGYGKLVYIAGSSDDGVKTSGLGVVENFDIPKPLRVATIDTHPRFVMFESVTGRVFYYDKDGINIPPPVELQFVISPPVKNGNEYGILIKQNSFSGKLSTSQIGNLTGFTPR